MIRVRLPSGEQVVSCLVADFDKTIIDLFDANGLEIARWTLFSLYQRVGVPGSALEQYADPYLMFRMVYFWAKSHRSLKQANSIQKAASKALEEMELHAAAKARLLPGVRETLQWLSSKGIRLAIVSTNSQSVVDYSLKINGVTQLIGVAIGRSSGMPVEDLKPAPTTIQQALAALSCEPGRAIYVGDSLGDMEAGRGAGVITIGVSTGQFAENQLLSAGAEVVLDNFSAIKELVVDSPTRNMNEDLERESAAPDRGSDAASGHSIISAEPARSLQKGEEDARTHSTSELEEIARRIRNEVVKALHAAQSGHPGSSLSIVEMLTGLYFGGFLRHDPANPNWEGRDYFLLSNGHAVPGLYACLALAGYYPVEMLNQLRQVGSPMEGHAKRGTFPGIEISSGSLGQGLSVGIGIALGLKLLKKPNRVFVMMSDGEQEEGSTWEAIMFAPKHRLNNLIAIVDKNGNQINGPTRIIMPTLDPLAPKYQAFHWETLEINGNYLLQVMEALQWATSPREGPCVIISHTITGKGVSYMEGDYHWHHGVITDELFEIAIRDLGEHGSVT